MPVWSALWFSAYAVTCAWTAACVALRGLLEAELGLSPLYRLVCLTAPGGGYRQTDPDRSAVRLDSTVGRARKRGGRT